MLAPTQHLLAVDEHVDHAGGVAVRVGVGRVVGDLLRIERDDVSEISARDAAAPVKTQVLRGKACEPTNRLLERHEPLVADVVPEQSRDEAEAFERSKALTLRGVLKDVRCPLLVIHGGKDRLFPPEQAERIVREAPNATLLLYPEGNHVCNNIPYKYRPAMADWMAEQLDAAH